MAEFTIQDSLKKHDKDKDGEISKKEFLGKKIFRLVFKPSFCKAGRSLNNRRVMLSTKYKTYESFCFFHCIVVL